LGKYVRSRSVYRPECGRHLLSPPLIKMPLFYTMCAKSDRLLEATGREPLLGGGREALSIPQEAPGL